MEILQRENFLEQQVKPKSCGYIAILYTLKKKKKKAHIMAFLGKL